jgi:hypothetical protein
VVWLFRLDKSQPIVNIQLKSDLFLDKRKEFSIRQLQIQSANLFSKQSNTRQIFYNVFVSTSSAITTNNMLPIISISNTNTELVNKPDLSILFDYGEQIQFHYKREEDLNNNEDIRNPDDFINLKLRLVYTCDPFITEFNLFTLPILFDCLKFKKRSRNNASIDENEDYSLRVYESVNLKRCKLI